MTNASTSRSYAPKAYLRLTRDHEASDPAEAERVAWAELVGRINKALK